MRSQRRLTVEQRFHIFVADYLRAVLPPHVCWTTFPAGGGGKTRGGLLKAMGLEPGWMDIILVRPTDGRLVGIELKSPKGRVSLEQLQLHRRLFASHVDTCIARSISDVENFLIAAGFPMRGALVRIEHRGVVR